MVATVVTQVLVDRDDPSFQKPSKPIGSFMDEKTAQQHREKDKWDIVEDAGRGFRRVVASPRPKRIVELEAIRRLLENDIVVVAVGGGGIPVVEDERGNLQGAAAVIDKDLATSLLASELKADLLIISTAVEKVCLNYRKPDQKDIDRMTLAEAKRYLAEGHFAPGSMKPKIEAIVEFLEAGGKQALITDPQHLVPALEGKTGHLDRRVSVRTGGGAALDRPALRPLRRAGAGRPTTSTSARSAAATPWSSTTSTGCSAAGRARRWRPTRTRRCGATCRCCR